MTAPDRGRRPLAGRSRPVLASFALVAGLTLSVMALGHASATNARFVLLSTEPDVSVSVTVNVSNFAFTPNAIEVAPGDTVTVTVVQTTSTPHTFTLFPAANYSFDPTKNTTDQLIAFASAHGTLLNLNVSGTPGASVTGTFTAPHLGLYQFVCLESGHFNEGMEGFLGSGVVPPGATAPNTGPGAPVFIISGTIVALLILAIVLGFVIGRRKGTVYEMPPERLGYPEPPASGPGPGTPGP